MARKKDGGLGGEVVLQHHGDGEAAGASCGTGPRGPNSSERRGDIFAPAGAILLSVERRVSGDSERRAKVDNYQVTRSSSCLQNL